MSISITRTVGHALVALAAGSLSPIEPAAAVVDTAAVDSGELVPVASASLRPLYRLEVIEVPEPPAHIAAPPSATQIGDCPVEVRAIVSGEGEAFAVVASGSTSELVRAGDGVRTPAGWVAVTAIEADHVVVRHGEATRRCALGVER